MVPERLRRSDRGKAVQSGCIRILFYLAVHIPTGLLLTMCGNASEAATFGAGEPKCERRCGHEMRCKSPTGGSSSLKQKPTAIHTGHRQSLELFVYKVASMCRSEGRRTFPSGSKHASNTPMWTAQLFKTIQALHSSWKGYHTRFASPFVAMHC